MFLSKEQLVSHVHCTVLTGLTMLKMICVVVVIAAVQQGEPTVCESPVVKLISFDGDITQRKLGESSIHLNGVRQLNHTL